MAVSPQRVRAQDLRTLATGALTMCGVPEPDAHLVADCLVQAELWGHPSHGMMRLPWYLARIRGGLVRPICGAHWASDMGAVALLDGRDGIGQVVAAKAMNEAIRRAKIHGVSAIAVRNSNHFGTAMYFTRMAVSHGQIALLVSNASPAMAPWGGRRQMVGTNPWSIAAPAGPHPPFMLDIANTVVARGKLFLAKQNQEAIPAGWAIDAEGRPTTDPVAALAGIILPMGGHKGYAIAVMMDVLAGLLSGSHFGSQVHGPYQAEQRSGCGHFIITLDINAFLPLQEFMERAGKLILELKSAPLAPGNAEIYYPGEKEARCEQRNNQQGIELPESTMAILATVAHASAPQLYKALTGADRAL